MFLIYLLLPLVLLGNSLTPILIEGRIRPLSAEPGGLNEKSKVLPDRYSSNWHALKDLENPDVEILYENRGELESLYEQNRFEELSDKLLDNYIPLAGTPFMESPGSTVSYPTLNQLKVESVYLTYPWIFGLIALYGLSLLTGNLGLFILAILAHTLLLATRIYILDRPPVANMMETMIYVPWISPVACLFYSHKAVIRLGSLLACALLGLLEWHFNPHSLDNLQAVLNSNFWLTIHVLMIVASYGIFILGGLIAHWNLLKPSADKENLLLKCLYIGLALLIPGTLLGGVWAAESWGRFWDWDPKEAWAFISIAVYVSVVHAYRMGKIGSLGLNIGSIIGFNAITFTWYGVNYILGTGLHSYGFGNGGQIYYYLFLIFEVLVISIALVLHSLKNKNKVC